MPKILIAAAAGRVARRVTATLCARGEPPRALVRDAPKARDVLVDDRGAPLPLEIVASDFADRDGLRRAFAGIEIAFLALGSSPQQVELEQRFIDVAAEVGLPHLVEQSAAYARSDSVASVLRWHAAIESHLMLNGMEIQAPVDEQEEIILSLAAGQTDRDSFTDWLRSHVYALKGNQDGFET